MHAITECPPTEALQRLLLGLAGGADAAELERHLASCPACAERAGSLPSEDGLVRSLKRVGTGDDTPMPQVVETLVSVLRRMHRPGTATHTADWSGADSFGAATVTLTEPGAFLAPSAGAGELGRFGPYAIHEVLATGGMGVVYRGYDSRLERVVAVKVIRPELLSADGMAERFLAEARAAAAVEHDHIVVVHAVEIHDGAPCLIMPLLKGQTLEQRLRETPGPLPTGEVMRVGRELTSALVAAHARGLIHRDIKPANLWLEAETGRLKVLDFGLAVVADSEGAGAVAGTPGYMAPEQIKGGAVDTRADLFSLGCVLYRVAAGVPPFTAQSVSGMLIRTLTRDPVPVPQLNPWLPPEVARLIEHLVAKNPAERPDSARAVLDELDAIEAGIAARRARITRRRWLLGVTAAGVAGGLGAWLLGTPEPRPVPEAPPVQVAFSADPEVGKVVLTRDGRERVLDLKSDNAVSLAPGDYTLRTAAEVPGRRLEPGTITVLAGEPRTVKLALVGEVAVTKAHDGAVTGVAAIPGKGRYRVLSASLDRTLNEWTPGGKSQPSASLTSPARCFATTPDGLTAVTAGGNKQEPFELGVRLWDTRAMKPRGEPLEGHTRQVGAVAISADGGLLISASRDELRLWDVEKRTHRDLVGHESAKVTAAAFDSKGKRALTGDEGGYLVLWDVAGAKPLKKFVAQAIGSSGGVRAVVFTPTGFVSAGDDGIVRVWDIATFKARELATQPKPVAALAVSRDGKRLLTGGEDGSVRLWSAVEGALLFTFTGHGKPVRGVAFTPDEREAVSGGEDNSVRVWRLPFD